MTTDNSTDSGCKYTLDPLPDRIKEAIQAAADEIGEPISSEKYREWYSDHSDDYPSLQVIQNSEYGSWTAACEAAGVLTGRQEYTNQDIIDALEAAVAAIGEPLSGVEYDEWAREADEDYPLSATFSNYDIGAFVPACEEIGIETTAIAPDGYTREDIISSIQQAADDCGEPLSWGEYNEWQHDSTVDHPTPTTITNGVFESWGAACEAASIPSGTELKWAVEDLLDAIRDASEDLGEQITQTEYETWQQAEVGDYPSSAVFSSGKYISWHNACRRAGVNSGRQLKHEPSERETLKQGIQDAAAECGEPLSKLEYQQWRIGVDETPATVDTIASVFGTWTTACLQSDVTPGLKSESETPERIEYIDALREAGALVGEPIGQNDYQTWVSECDCEYPSVEAITTHFESWGVACGAAEVVTR